jgi:hypothetical protein
VLFKRSKTSATGLDKLDDSEEAPTDAEEEDPGTEEEKKACLACPIESHCAVGGYISMVNHNTAIELLQQGLADLRAYMLASFTTMNAKIDKLGEEICVVRMATLTIG